VVRPDDFTLEYSDPAVEIWRLTFPRHPPKERPAGEG
jgi:hypothetical protein